MILFGKTKVRRENINPVSIVYKGQDRDILATSTEIEIRTFNVYTLFFSSWRMEGEIKEYVLKNGLNIPVNSPNIISVT